MEDGSWPVASAECGTWDVRMAPPRGATADSTFCIPHSTFGCRDGPLFVTGHLSSATHRGDPGRMVISIDDRDVSLTSFAREVMGGARVGLSANRAWRRRVSDGREILEKALEDGQTVYGVSTGVGNNSSRGVDNGA